MLKEEFQFYLDNQSQLVSEFNGKFLVIIGQKVVGAYRTMHEAATKAAKKYQLGTFLIQQCTEGEEAYTQDFYNVNVVF